MREMACRATIDVPQVGIDERRSLTTLGGSISLGSHTAMVKASLDDATQPSVG
jgi:hypothetical protein